MPRCYLSNPVLESRYISSAESRLTHSVSLCILSIRKCFLKNLDIARRGDRSVRIARIVDTNNREMLTALQTDGRMLRIEGDPLLVETPKITNEVVEVQRWLPPVEPEVRVL